MNILENKIAISNCLILFFLLSGINLCGIALNSLFESDLHSPSFVESTIFYLVVSVLNFTLIRFVKSPIKWFIIPVVLLAITSLLSLGGTSDYGGETLFIIGQLVSSIIPMIFFSFEGIQSIILIIGAPLFLLISIMLAKQISMKVIKIQRNH